MFTPVIVPPVTVQRYVVPPRFGVEYVIVSSKQAWLRRPAGEERVMTGAGLAVTVTFAVVVTTQRPAVSVTVSVRVPAVSQSTVIVLFVVPEAIVRSVAVPETVQAYVLPAYAGVLYTSVEFEHALRLPEIVGVGMRVTATF